MIGLPPRRSKPQNKVKKAFKKKKARNEEGEAKPGEVVLSGQDPGEKETQKIMPKSEFKLLTKKLAKMIRKSKETRKQ